VSVLTTNKLTSKTGHARQAGQGMTEYILIVAIVAVLSIAAVTVFGDQLRALFGYSTEQLGGDDTATIEQIDTSGTINKKLGD
jgi:pilus assembly protein Flp/PilA